jgi:hypothetical protein
LSKIVGKVKTGVSNIADKPTTVLMQLGLGVAIGVIIDLLLEFAMYHGIKQWIDDYVGTEDNRLDWGFAFYYNHPELLSIAWDDVILLIITMGMLFFGWFRKRFWSIIGFFLGWYLSSCHGWYQAILKPIFEETEFNLGGA